MKKLTLTLIAFSTISFANDFEKQIPEMFNKMIEQFNEKKSALTQENVEDIVKNYDDNKLIFCETKFQRNIISKKRNWTLDKTNKIFINMQIDSYYHLNECKVLKEVDKVYL